MSMFVYITDNCQQEAKLHAMSDDIKTVAKQIERTQNTLMFDRFPQPYLVKKKFSVRQGRLIGSEHIVDVDGQEHKLVLLLSVMIRGDKDYDGQKGFGHDPEGYGKKKFDPIIEGLKLRFADIIREHTYTEPPEQKPGLQGGEVAFVTEPVSTGGAAKEPSIAESRQWIEKVSSRVAILPRIRDFVSEILELAAIGERTPDLEENCELVPQNKRLRIAYQWLENGQVLYLHDLFEDGHEPEGAIKKENAKTAQRSFYRAYPTWMLSDEELWVQLEQDRFGNFSLSPEENEILHPPSGKSLQFPLFINGRAGSGKSTILQYLYAEYLARYARLGSDAGQPPAYFACNGELIRSAIALVKSILLNNPAYSGTECIKRLVEDDSLFRNSFRVYHEFLLSLVPAPERCRFFPNDRYVDYARFTKLWIAKFGKTQNAYRDYGPDISWHVIRTYIKGLSTDGILEEDEYQFLRKSEKSVSEAVFSRIYKSVWEAWYMEETDPDMAKRYWDDQDLVRYVLDNDLIKRANAASLGIFCDEAQDFTHIELESFLRMSVFSERSVYPHDIDKIPFVFAGDEFQTLNPTGFKWESVKAAFVEKFIFGICPIANEAKTKVNLVDLKNNYRSIPNIVRFGNTVQALRAAKFALTNVQPQLEWKEDVGRPVSYFRSDDESFWNALKAREDVHVIVPCHANEEIEFIRKDPVLSRHVTINEAQGTTRPPVMSTVRAKGLEYPCVVVYGFGAALADGDGDILDFSDRPEEDDRTRFLALEYFLNRLYVAVSRPRSQLYVVDTGTGRKRLWKFAESVDSVKMLLKHIRKPEDWRDHVENFEDGTSLHLSATYSFNPEEMAQQYESSGRSDRDPVALNYAASYYGQCKNMQNKAKSCLALALVFQDRFEDAAKIYGEINEFENAGDCYWKMRSADGWSAMSDLSRKQKDLGTRIEYSAARALSSKTAQSVANVLDTILKKIDAGEQSAFSTPEWTSAISALAAFVEKERGATDASILDLFLKLIKAGIVPARVEFVEKVYESGNLDVAAELLPLAGIQKGRMYQKVMFAKSAFPECLPFYLSEGAKTRREDDEKIVAGFAESSDASGTLGAAERLAIAQAHVHLGKTRTIRDFILSLNSPQAYAALSDEATEAKEKRMFHGLSLAAHAAISTRDVILHNIFGEITGKQNATLADSHIVAVLARGSFFKREEAPVDFNIRKAISDFLRKFVTVWQHTTGLTEAEKLCFVSAGEIGVALEYFGHSGDDAKFYKSEFQRTKNVDLLARWLFLQSVRMRQMHGQQLSALRREVENLKQKHNVNGMYSNTPLIGAKLDVLFANIFPSDQDLARQASDIAAEKAERQKAAETAGNGAAADGAAAADRPEEPKAAAAPEPVAAQEKPAEVAGQQSPEAPADNVDAEQKTDASVAPAEKPTADPVPEKPAEPQPAPEPVPEVAPVAEEKPAAPVEPGGVAPAPAPNPTQAARDLPLAPDKFKLTFFAKKGRLNIENMDTGDQWSITASGVSVESEAKGHVQSMPIEGTGFTVTTSPTFIVLRDDRCGYEFTIRL